jgi:hypothetical protein
MNKPIAIPNHGLWSLWDMLLTYSKAFGVNIADLEMTRGMIKVEFASDIDVPLKADHPLSPQLRENLNRFLLMFDQIPSLATIKGPLGRTLSLLTQEATARRVLDVSEQFQLSLFDALGEHYYYHVDGRLIPYYAAELPFGDAVFERFPSATDDIRNAGQCIALGQGTAAVFHLMLVLELGLAALAKGMDIPYAPSWESYLKQITARMAVEHKKKPRGWKKDEAFYRDVAGDLQLIKVAWRNPTMHIIRGRSYTVPEAENVYKAADALMRRLATKFREPTRRPPVAAGMVEQQP